MASLLSRRGVDRDTAREACQHAFAVFLDKRPAVETPQHAFAWLNIVAHRQVSKWHRRRRWETTEEPPDQALSDIAENVEPRLLLEAAIEAFSRLRPKDRDVLRAAAEGRERGATRAEQNRIALHVHRARKRLHDKLREWWAVLPWAKWRQANVELASMWSPSVGLNVFAILVVGSAALLPHLPSSDRVAVAPAVVVPLPFPTESPPHRVLTGQQLVTVSSSASVLSRSDVDGSQRGSPPAPLPAASPLALDNQRVEVDSPATYGPVEVATRPRRPGDDALTCWGNLGLVPDGCIPHPLRQGE